MERSERVRKSTWLNPELSAILCFHLVSRCRRDRYKGIADSDFFPFLILRPAFNGDRCMSLLIGCTVFHKAVASQRITQTYHVHETHPKLGKVGIGYSGKLFGDKLSEEGHTEHAVSDDVIQAYLAGSLRVEMDGIVIAGCLSVATQLLLGNRWLDQGG